MKIDTLTIVGVGLIGGSIGLAARRRDLAEHIIGVGRQTASLETARNVGAIDEGTLDLAQAVGTADVVVFCTPVNLIIEQIDQCAPACKTGALLTDAGSTKTAIVRGVAGKLSDGVHFVGSHPLAGSEKKGPEFADADLFQDRLTIITPTLQTDPAAMQRTQDFWQALGSRVRIMTPEEHDQALAMTSHLPHLAAAALAGMLPEDLFELTATGFRDTTRVAAGDPSIWTGIFEQNREAVLHALQCFAERLANFHQALEEGDTDTLDSLLQQGKKVRDALGN